MKYNVRMKVIDIGSVSVEADSIEEAKEKAEEAYLNGEVFWKDSTIAELEVVNEKRRDRDVR